MTATRLIVTPGEPAGVGTETLLMAIDAGVGNLATIDDPDRLLAMAGAMGVGLSAETAATPAEAEGLPHGTLAVLPVEWPEPPVPGQPSAANAPVVIEAIARAARMARDGEAAALVTNPIQKSTLHAAGFDCPGHTEYLARIDGEKSGGAEPHPVMMLHSEALRVVPLTVHVPLSAVPALVTRERIATVAGVLDDALRRDFGVEQPRIAVAGLNPHAGEDGAMGGEEADTIGPAIEDLKGAGMHIDGPHPADSLFHEDRRQEYDAVIAMYHDQALIPVKTLDFHHGVNATLGLGFVRTSPDHGTALDLAGRFEARPDSLVEAIRLASAMAGSRRASRD